MRGDSVEILVECGTECPRRYVVTATRPGRRVEVTVTERMVEISEVLRTGEAVRKIWLPMERVIHILELRRGGREGFASTGTTEPGDSPLAASQGVASVANSQQGVRPTPPAPHGPLEAHHGGRSAVALAEPADGRPANASRTPRATKARDTVTGTVNATPADQRRPGGSAKRGAKNKERKRAAARKSRGAGKR